MFFFLRYIRFYHLELFCETREYFLNFFKIGSRIEFDYVKVFVSDCSEINESAPSFIVEGTMEILSQNSPLKTIPEKFFDNKLKDALRYVTWAEYLDIRESKKVCLPIIVRGIYKTGNAQVL